MPQVLFLFFSVCSCRRCTTQISKPALLRVATRTRLVEINPGKKPVTGKIRKKKEGTSVARVNERAGAQVSDEFVVTPRPETGSYLESALILSSSDKTILLADTHMFHREENI